MNTTLPTPPATISFRAVTEPGVTEGYRKNTFFQLYLGEAHPTLDGFASLIQRGSGRVELVCTARSHERGVTLAKVLAVAVLCTHFPRGGAPVPPELWALLADDSAWATDPVWQEHAKTLSKALRAANK